MSKRNRDKRSSAGAGPKGDKPKAASLPSSAPAIKAPAVAPPAVVTAAAAPKSPKLPPPQADAKTAAPAKPAAPARPAAAKPVAPALKPEAVGKAAPPSKPAVVVDAKAPAKPAQKAIAKPATPKASAAKPVAPPAPVAARPASTPAIAPPPAKPEPAAANRAEQKPAPAPRVPSAKSPAAKPTPTRAATEAKFSEPVVEPVINGTSINGVEHGHGPLTFLGTPKAAAAPAPDASSAATVAPPAKRARASQPNPAAISDAAPERNAEPQTSASRAHSVEQAAAPEPALEQAATIAVASDRADSEPAARLARGSSGDRLREAAAFGSSQSLLSTDYYFRQYGAHGMRSLAAEVDDFGFDPHVDAKVKPLLEALCKRYFRVELVGGEHVPAHGRALLVANRAGALPWDGLVLRTALRMQRPELSPLRWLAEDSVIHYPFMGVFMNRLGAVRACPENAERLLAQDRLVAVFPEGAQGSRKLFRDRYRLQRFGRGGYVKLALKLGVPIFPTAIIGAEEINPVLGRSRLLGRILGSESLPLTPTFPWLGLAGLLPAPVRWRIAVGAPIDLSSYGPEAAEDALVVHRLNEQIRSSLQGLVDQGKSARGSALFG